jgi:uncharacterized membrane protein YoaK (UPF0700 family)
LTQTSSLSAPDHTAFRATLPPVLSFVSGFVDTIGFLGLFGLLTSQVTGSFVAAGAAFVEREPGLTSKLLAIPMFMVGACAITLLVALLKRSGRNPMPYALTIVATLICAFMILALNGQPFTSPDAPTAINAAILAFIAMGAESALVRVLFKGSVPANFMTGNITQVAVEATDLALAHAGWLNVGNPEADAARIKAASAQLKILLPMIICFILGATVGAHAFIALGFFALAIAMTLIATAALWAGLTNAA